MDGAVRTDRCCGKGPHIWKYFNGFKRCTRCKEKRSTSVTKANPWEERDIAYQPDAA